MRVSGLANNLSLFPNFAQPPLQKNRSSFKNPSTPNKKRLTYLTKKTNIKSGGDIISSISKAESIDQSESRSSFDSDSEETITKRSKLNPKLSENKFHFEIAEEKNDSISDWSI